MPFVLLVEFDQYSGLLFPGCGLFVPIFSVTRTFKYKSVSCSWTQFPLRLAYTITVYKSQGLTLSRAVLNINQKEHCLGLSYVAVSRVKRLEGLLFKYPFDFEHFTPAVSNNANDHKADVIYRSRQLL
jgi:ATP-dependent DNA helicase PIF1